MRKDHIMLTGLWFGKEKPQMTEKMLKPSVDESLELCEKGFSWKDNQGKQMLQNDKIISFYTCKNQNESGKRPDGGG